MDPRKDQARRLELIFERLRLQHEIEEVDNRRRAQRRSWSVPLTVTLLEHVATGGSKREVDVVTHDISPGGFSFIHNGFVHVGTEVATLLTMLPDRPKVMGVVRNCIHLANSMHRVGVQFIQVARSQE